MDKLQKIKRIETMQMMLFYLIIVFLVFNNIPKTISLGFIGGAVGNKLVIYPLIIGAILEGYYLYLRRKDGEEYTKEAKFMGIFILVFLLINLVSLIHGMLIFPYYDMILKGPKDQIMKLPTVLAFVNAHGIHISHQQLLKVWMTVRPLKGLLVNTFFTFGMAFLLFTWCRRKPSEYFELLLKGIIISSCILVVYNLIEMMYLAHYSWAEKVLVTINPYIHLINDDGYTWPPILWKGQMRSVFDEPSHFGIYCAFAIPLLWCAFTKIRSIAYKSGIGFLILFMTFCLFLAKTRTGFGIFLGECVLLCILSIYVRNKKNIFHAIFILVLSGLAFAGSLGFITHFENSPNIENPMEMQDSAIKKRKSSQAPTKKESKPSNVKTKKESKPSNVKTKKESKPSNVNDDAKTAANKYVDSNLKSLASKNQRSNNSRYSVMKADIETGMEHPILGVGSTFRSAYVSKKLASYENQGGHEVRMWLYRIRKLGILRTGIPALGQYTTLFSTTGMLGLLAYLVLPVYLAYSYFKRIRNNRYNLPLIFTFISFIGMLGAGVGSTINSTYCYWLILAVGFALVLSHDNN